MNGQDVQKIDCVVNLLSGWETHLKNARATFTATTLRAERDAKVSLHHGNI